MNKSKKPLITIVTVCYNVEKTINDTIESVLNQTYKNIEYILVDGASTDRTVEIIKSYKKEAEEKGITYKWISESDKGIYYAMNKGIDMANGVWIAFMNAGDSYYDNYSLSTLIENSQGADVVYGHKNCIYEDHEFIGYATTWKKTNYKIPFCHQSCMIKTDLQKENKYNTEYRILADLYLFFKLHNEKKRFVKVNEVISNFSMDGISQTISIEILRERQNISFKYNSSFLYRFMYVYWEIKKIVFYYIKKMPFSNKLLQLKHYLETLINNKKEK